MKIALVHDYLKEYGGAERVLEVMHEMWPEAPLYTSFVDFTSMGEHAKRFRGWDIRTSWVQKFPFIKRWISPLRFLAPWIWGSFSAKGGSASGGNLSEYDVVISSSGWFMCRGVALLRGAEGATGSGPATRVSRDSHQFDREMISPSPSSTQSLRSEDSSQEALARVTRTKAPLHICYIHHPPRNLYGYATGSDLQKYWIVRVYAAIVNFFLRQYDFDSAQAVDYFIANSKETARRVEKFYRRDSVVIYPPIGQTIRDTRYAIREKEHISSHASTHIDYFLSVGRLTYAKRVDLAIEACRKLDVPLKIVGRGKEEEYLKKLASQGQALRSKDIEFLGSVSDEELSRLYQGARALIFSALDEDFGMVPVEAMAHGTPVIGLAQGGVKETVLDGVTGVLFQEPTVESLVGALGRFERLGGLGRHVDKQCKKHAEKFSKERFKKELLTYVRNVYKQGRIEAKV